MHEDSLPEAYLDIMTTGLSPYHDEITVIGIYLVNGNDDMVLQLVDGEITKDNLLEALEGVFKIYTYNGSGFALPFIHSRLDVDLTEGYCHHDLMHDCWKNNLYGGLKKVETKLGIPRKLKAIGGVEAIMLWY
ncbi:unnamed protein product, partial [marine sediment metagenome]